MRNIVASLEPSKKNRLQDVLRAEKLPFTDPRQRYHISTSQNNPLDIGIFLRSHKGDPALQVQLKSPLSSCS
jgi:hypothetical protein